MWDPIGTSEREPGSFDILALAQTRCHHSHQLLFPIVMLHFEKKDQMIQVNRLLFRQ